MIQLWIAWTRLPTSLLRILTAAVVCMVFRYTILAHVPWSYSVCRCYWLTWTMWACRCSFQKHVRWYYALMTIHPPSWPPFVPIDWCQLEDTWLTRGWSHRGLSVWVAVYRCIDGFSSVFESREETLLKGHQRSQMTTRSKLELHAHTINELPLAWLRFAAVYLMRASCDTGDGKRTFSEMMFDFASRLTANLYLSRWPSFEE